MAAFQNCFKLYRLSKNNSTCAHYLLARVTRPDRPRGSQSDEQRAEKTLETNFLKVLERFCTRVLPKNCPDIHESILIGDFQDYPLCDENLELYRGSGNREIDIWYSTTKEGPPWIAIALAGTSDKAFWDEVTLDKDNLSRTPIGDLTKVTAFFLTQEDL